ncbi:MAG TPA: GNAT family N-acetyltransferase [Kofleriaceae bacterium]|nr:GNAT family N-acetyltransferase [Kofleriaceae bacterium]
MPTLTTERLILREWRDEDRAPFAALNADPAVMEHFPALMTRAQSDAAFDRVQAHFAREGFGLWALETPATPFLGFTGLARPGFRPDVIEIGWRLARAHWGHGFAAEAALAAADWGFRNLALPELVSFVVPANVRSQRVMARLGMQRDPSGDFDHPAIPDGSPVKRHWLFRLPAEVHRQRAR